MADNKDTKDQTDLDFGSDDFEGLVIQDTTADDDFSDIQADDDSEDGVFAPVPEKRKGNSSSLIAGVAVIALLAGGGYYAITNPSIMQKLGFGATESSGVADVANDAGQQVANDVIDATGGNVPDTGAPDQNALAETGSEMPADMSGDIAPELPQPQPMANATDAAPETQAAPETPELAQETTQQVSPEATPETNPESVTQESQADGAVDASTPVESSAAPAESASNETTPASQAEPVVEKVSDVSAPSTPDSMPASPASDVKAPAETELAKSAASDTGAVAQAVADKPVSVGTDQVPVSTASVSTVAASTPAAAPVAVQAPAAQVYFDAGAQVQDLGPRKIDPVAEPGQAFVVVSKAAGPQEVESMLIAANRALKLERYDAAIGFYDKLYKINPRDPRILMGRAVALHKLGEADRAIAAYDDVLAVDPKNADALVNMVGLVRGQYPAVALQKLLDMRQRYPNHAGIASQIAVTYADLDNLQDAYKYMQIAASLEPDNAQHFFNMAVMAERMGKRDAAIKMYEKALDVSAASGGRGVSRDTIYDRLAKLRR